jgi:hypothetical protein
MEYDSFIYGGMGPDVEGLDNPTARNKLVVEYLTGTNNKLPPYPRNLFPGGARCMEDLVEAGLERRSYRTIKSCERLEELFVVVNGRDIDDYCMPSYGAPPPKAGL